VTIVRLEPAVLAIERYNELRNPHLSSSPPRGPPRRRSAGGREAPTRRSLGASSWVLAAGPETGVSRADPAWYRFRPRPLVRPRTTPGARGARPGDASPGEIQVIPLARQ
jgi:hypothetical protein